MPICPPRDGDKIIEIACYLARGLPTRDELPAGRLRGLMGEQSGLELARHLQLALDAAGFHRDLIEPGVLDRDRRACSDGGQQLQIGVRKDAGVQPVVYVDDAGHLVSHH